MESVIACCDIGGTSIKLSAYKLKEYSYQQEGFCEQLFFDNNQPIAP